VPWLEILTGAAMLLGLAGTVVPVWPGLAIVWAAGLVYGLLGGFGGLGWAVFVLMTLLALVGTVTTLALPARSGARRGARLGTLAAAIVGALVGAIVLPALGLPIGALVGVWASELARVGDAGEAWRNTLAVLRAFGVGVLTELALGAVMLAAWLVWATWG
jgi:uncharacterized protein YqgC (DUF456 family)